MTPGTTIIIKTEMPATSAAITFSYEQIQEAAETIANAIGAFKHEVEEYIRRMCDDFCLLREPGDTVTIRYPLLRRERSLDSLRELAEEMRKIAEKIMEGKDYIVEVLPLAAHQDKCPPYIPRLHPRKDWQRRAYWLRTRSNPKRRSHH